MVKPLTRFLSSYLLLILVTASVEASPLSATTGDVPELRGLGVTCDGYSRISTDDARAFLGSEVSRSIIPRSGSGQWVSGAVPEVGTALLRCLNDYCAYQRSPDLEQSLRYKDAEFRAADGAPRLTVYWQSALDDDIEADCGVISENSDLVCTFPVGARLSNGFRLDEVALVGALYSKNNGTCLRLTTPVMSRPFTVPWSPEVFTEFAVVELGGNWWTWE